MVQCRTMGEAPQVHGATHATEQLPAKQHVSLVSRAKSTVEHGQVILTETRRVLLIVQEDVPQRY